MRSLRLTLKSIWNRKVSAILSVVTISLSVSLFLGVDRIHQSVEESFKNTISGTDLIVGARSGAIQLLLYSVFRLGEPVNNLSWKTYEDLKKHRQVKWTVPLSLGDSHHGFRVLGTNQEYFKRYEFQGDRHLRFDEGKSFADVFEAVMGSEAAKELGYQIGSQVILSHGVDEVALVQHQNREFTVVGILEKTGTPVDRTVHVSLESIEALHVDWQGGAPPLPGEELSRDEILSKELQPTQITAFLVGLRSKFAMFQMQRMISTYDEEALMAILPGITLASLWETVAIAETALKVISFFVIVVGLLGMLSMILTTLNERRREMAIFRSLGAGPRQVFTLLLLESGALTFAGTVLGLVWVYLGIFLARPVLQSEFGIWISLKFLNTYELSVLGGVVVMGLLVGVYPAWRAYRNSLIDGLTIRF